MAAPAIRLLKVVGCIPGPVWQGHVFATVPEELLEVLESCDLSACEPREPVNPSLFPALVDVEMGFALDSKSD